MSISPNLTENAVRVLRARYLRRDAERRIVETPDELFERVAAGVAQAELLLHGARQAAFWREEFLELLASLDFLPNSPTLMNAGTPLGQLSACFVLPVGDSMEEIFEALRQMALIQRTGGGTGFSFSRLRPRGATILSTGGQTPGPVSFMKIFDCATEHIKLGGKRRGANMGILRADHPDILEFITSKVEDGIVLRNFNISVGATDAFMEAVREDRTYDLVDPRDGRPVKQMNAREVFERIVDSAWRSGDPGLVFLDTINRTHPTPHLGAIEATNPCVPGDTWVHTSDGPRQVKDLLYGPFTAIVQGREYRASHFWHTGARPVYRIETDRGFSIRLTANHKVQVERFRTPRGDRVVLEWVEAKDLRPGDRVVLHNHRGYEWQGAGTFEEGWLLGRIVGDGGYNPEKYHGYVRYWGEAKEYMAGLAVSAVRQLPYRVRADLKRGKHNAHNDTLTVAAAALDELAAGYITPGDKELLPAVERGSSEFYRGFLRGLFDADGSVQGSPEKGLSLRLTQVDLERLRVVQRMLARLGIISTIYQNRKPARSTWLPDGRGGRRLYRTAPVHELVISRDNIVEFARRVGFHDPGKRSALRAALTCLTREAYRERFTAKVAAILPDGEEPVYDCTVEGAHQFDANGFVAHNCGEIPLLPYESCNLGSINLSHMVRERDARAEVDWDKLGATVRKAFRFLDDVIEVSRYPVPEIERMTHGNRKIGLGVMGFADLLIRLGISYDSDEAVELGDRLMKFVADAALEASRELAGERGVYPNWPGSRHEKEGLRVRNATRTAIAPTGTISIIAGTSASIEPLFAVAYRRSHVLEEETLYEVNPLFREHIERRGLNPEEIVPRVMETGSLKGVPGIPDDVKRLFVTALEIPWERHLQIQAAFQRHVDNSVSKTINMPEDATPDDVRSAYWQAWELGLKGITIFRYGSKGVQVLEMGAQEKGYQKEHTARCDPTECRI